MGCFARCRCRDTLTNVNRQVVPITFKIIAIIIESEQRQIASLPKGENQCSPRAKAALSTRR